jgi:hypothetical protein
VLKFDLKDFNKEMKSAMDYSKGFINGLNQNEQYFNNQLAEIIKEAFYKYVDSVARLEPDRLHHVYEWEQTGVDRARLFRIEAFSGQQSIRFVTEFMQSTSTSPSANEPFVDKASVMEAGTMITIAPRGDGPLAFEGDDGEMVFTNAEVTIENPGGNVAGQFAAVAREFFENYLDQALLKELIIKLENPVEFTQGWGNGMNYGTGQRQAKKYLTIKGGIQ